MERSADEAKRPGWVMPWCRESRYGERASSAAAEAAPALRRCAERRPSTGGRAAPARGGRGNEEGGPAALRECCRVGMVLLECGRTSRGEGAQCYSPTALPIGRLVLTRLLARPRSVGRTPRTAAPVSRTKATETESDHGYWTEPVGGKGALCRYRGQPVIPGVWVNDAAMRVTVGPSRRSAQALQVTDRQRCSSAPHRSPRHPEASVVAPAGMVNRRRRWAVVRSRGSHRTQEGVAGEFTPAKGP